MADDLPPDVEQSIDRAAVNAKLEELVEGWPCPQCGERSLELSWRLVAKPLGTFSLSGSQLKFSANEIPFIHCNGCGLTAEGNVARD